MDVITQTKHYFSSFQTANLVEGITGLSSHYIIPSGSCKVHRQASNGHCFFSTSNNVPTMASKLWCKDLNWLPRGCWSQMLAWQKTYVLSHQKLLAVPAPIFYIFCLKKKWTHKCKNKEKTKKQPRTLQMIYTILIYFDGMVSRRRKNKQKLYYSKFHILEFLCLGNVFFCSKPCSVKMCMSAEP